MRTLVFSVREFYYGVMDSQRFIIGSIRLFFLVVILFVLQQFVRADVSTNSWAWSETIGWINFDCAATNSCSGSNYTVRIGSEGTLSGYAWSEHVGWISFNETSGCPSSSCLPRRNLQTGELSGWAKALSGGSLGSGGWDGWISLNCSNENNCARSSYSVSANSNNEWSGWAWGSDVIGWIQFLGSDFVPVVPPRVGILSFIASPESINSGESSRLSWETEGFQSCSINQSIGSVLVDGARNVSPTTTTIYTLACSGVNGSESQSARIGVPRAPRSREIVPE